MRRKYLLLSVVALALILAGCQTAKEVRREGEDRLAREKIAVPHYSDNELITNYYQINAELQGALDDLESARRQATRYSLEQSKKTSEGGGFAQGFAEGFARTYNPGVANERFFRIKVDTLRQIRALYLGEIARRGLKLPG